MKLRRQRERENLEWFVSGSCARCAGLDSPHACLRRLGEPSDEAFQEYLNHSERGVPIKSSFNYYQEAKRRRGILLHELWEDSFYAHDGSWPGWDALLREENGEPVPRHIADFISRDAFRGQDREKVMAHYDSILKENMV